MQLSPIDGPATRRLPQLCIEGSLQGAILLICSLLRFLSNLQRSAVKTGTALAAVMHVKMCPFHLEGLTRFSSLILSTKLVYSSMKGSKDLASFFGSFSAKYFSYLSNVQRMSASIRVLSCLHHIACVLTSCRQGQCESGGLQHSCARPDNTGGCQGSATARVQKQDLVLAGEGSWIGNGAHSREDARHADPGLMITAAGNSLRIWARGDEVTLLPISTHDSILIRSFHS